MKIVIDTNSLLSLVRYYLPFDQDNYLRDFFKEKIATGELIIIDRVYDECRYVAGGLVLKELHFLSDKDFQKVAHFPYKTNAIIPPAPAKFLRMVENQFAIGTQKNRLTDTEFEVRKTQFLESADMRQIILCLYLHDRGEEVIQVTEETVEPNDNKLFKKIPSICELLGISTITLPDLIKREISLHFK